MKRLFILTFALCCTLLAGAQTKSFNFKLNGVNHEVSGELIRTSGLGEGDNASLVETIYFIEDGIFNLYEITTTNQGKGEIMSAQVMTVPVADINIKDAKIKEEENNCSISFFTQGFKSSVKTTTYSDFMDAMTNELMLGDIPCKNKEAAEAMLQLLSEEAKK